MHSPKVVIMCGGMGTRLREETEYIPKPMVRIGNKPIIWHIMRGYARFGCKDFVLPLGYKGEVIKEYFLNYRYLNQDFTIDFSRGGEPTVHDEEREAIDWKVTLVDTGVDTLKGARLKHIEPYIDGPEFMATYGDGVCDVDIDALLAFHRKHGRIATITGVRPPSLFGELLLQGDRIEVFSEKPQTSAGVINGGFFVFNRKIFDYLSADPNCDLEKGPFEVLAQEGELMVFQHAGQWACMDTYRDMKYLNQLWDENRAFWKKW